MYTNLSGTAKVDKKKETIKVLVECDNTERLFIAEFDLLDVAGEMEDLFNASEPNYKEMPDYEDINYHIDHNDNLQAIENLLEKGKLDLTPYFEPKKVKRKAHELYVSSFVVDSYIEQYGFVERSDFGDAKDVLFVH